MERIFAEEEELDRALDRELAAAPRPATLFLPARSGRAGTPRRGAEQIRAICWTLSAADDGSLPPAETVRAGLGPIAQWCFQLEVAPSTGRLHWQGWARHTGAKTFEQWHKFLPERTWIEKQKARHDVAAYQYTYDEGKRITAEETSRRGLSQDERGPHYKGIMLPTRGVVSPLEGKELYPWQSEAMAMYQGPISDRTIVWFHEAEGNTGKSALAKHLALRGDVLTVSGNAGDVKHGASTWVMGDPKSKVEPKPLRLVIWDIPRSKDNFLSFQALEDVKNGCFFSPKYESRQVIFNAPHVWVFSNHEPELDKLSRDRWVVYRISKDKELVHIEPAWPIFDPATRVAGKEGLQRARF